MVEYKTRDRRQTRVEKQKIDGRWNIRDVRDQDAILSRLAVLQKRTRKGVGYPVRFSLTINLPNLYEYLCFSSCASSQSVCVAAFLLVADSPRKFGISFTVKLKF